VSEVELPKRAISRSTASKRQNTKINHNLAAVAKLSFVN
jgi:hypothetical protein